jgi:hypothetical protein
MFFFRNETSIVNLELIRGDEKVQHVVYGQDYTLRAHISQPDGKTISKQYSKITYVESFAIRRPFSSTSFHSKPEL